MRALVIVLLLLPLGLSVRAQTPPAPKQSPPVPKDGSQLLVLNVQIGFVSVPMLDAPEPPMIIIDRVGSGLDATGRPANGSSAKGQTGTAAPVLPGITQVERRQAKRTEQVFQAALQVHNVSAKEIKLVEWEYRLSDPGSGTELQYLKIRSKQRIQPDAQAFLSSRLPTPSGKSSHPRKLAQPFVALLRITYADGTSWQRN